MSLARNLSIWGVTRSHARAAPERRRDSRLASLATQNGALAFYTLGGAREQRSISLVELSMTHHWQFRPQALTLIHFVSHTELNFELFYN